MENLDDFSSQEYDQDEHSSEEYDQDEHTVEADRSLHSKTENSLPLLELPREAIRIFADFNYLKLNPTNFYGDYDYPVMYDDPMGSSEERNSEEPSEYGVTETELSQVRMKREISYSDAAEDARNYFLSDETDNVTGENIIADARVNGRYCGLLEDSYLTAEVRAVHWGSYMIEATIINGPSAESRCRICMT